MMESKMEAQYLRTRAPKRFFLKKPCILASYQVENTAQAEDRMLHAPGGSRPKAMRSFLILFIFSTPRRPLPKDRSNSYPEPPC